MKFQVLHPNFLRSTILPPQDPFGLYSLYATISFHCYTISHIPSLFSPHSSRLMRVRVKDLGEHRWLMRVYPERPEERTQFNTIMAAYADRCWVKAIDTYGDTFHYEVRSRDHSLRTLLLLKYST